MRHASTLLVTAFAISGVVGCAARTSQPSAGAASQPSVDSIVDRLGALELQRVAPRPAEELNAQIAHVYAQLHALPNHGAVERSAAQRVLAALDARYAALASRVREARAVYTDEYPPVRDLLLEQRRLDGRRTEIRSTLGVERDALNR
jgi:hypothetical protein